jgi:hypothetical protein
MNLQNVNIRVRNTNYLNTTILIYAVLEVEKKM